MRTRTVGGMLLVGLVLVLGAGCTAPKSGLEVATAESVRSLEERQSQTEADIAALKPYVEASFNEGRELRADVLPRLAKHDNQLADHERRLVKVELEATNLRAALAEAYQKAESIGKAHVRLAARQGHEEILQGVRNSTAWKLEWNGDKLASVSEKRLAELQHGLQNGQKLVSIVAFCDMKTKTKCDNASQKAGVVADRLRVASSFVERQPGKEGWTVVFTVRRDK